MRLLSSSVADPYHFDKDPDPGCEKFLPDPGKNDIDPFPGKKGLSTRKML